MAAIMNCPQVKDCSTRAELKACIAIQKRASQQTEEFKNQRDAELQFTEKQQAERLRQIRESSAQKLLSEKDFLQERTNFIDTNSKERNERYAKNEAELEKLFQLKLESQCIYFKQLVIDSYSHTLVLSHKKQTKIAERAEELELQETSKLDRTRIERVALHSPLLHQVHSIFFFSCSFLVSFLVCFLVCFLFFSFLFFSFLFFSFLFFSFLFFSFLFFSFLFFSCSFLFFFCSFLFFFFSFSFLFLSFFVLFFFLFFFCSFFFFSFLFFSFCFFIWAIF
jgi:hypothetical protein